MLEVLFVFLLVAGIGLWFFALLDLAGSKFENQLIRTSWLLIILFFPIVGSLVYLLLGKKQGGKNLREFHPNFKRE